MAKVKRNTNEPIERMLKRFKREVKDEGIIEDYKKHECYEKPSERRKRKFKEGYINSKRQENQKDIILWNIDSDTKNPPVFGGWVDHK